jgi:hypothetical protein
LPAKVLAMVGIRRREQDCGARSPSTIRNAIKPIFDSERAESGGFAR